MKITITELVGLLSADDIQIRTAAAERLAEATPGDLVKHIDQIRPRISDPEPRVRLAAAAMCLACFTHGADIAVAVAGVALREPAAPMFLEPFVRRSFERDSGLTIEGILRQRLRHRATELLVQCSEDSLDAVKVALCAVASDGKLLSFLRDGSAMNILIALRKLAYRLNGHQPELYEALVRHYYRSPQLCNSFLDLLCAIPIDRDAVTARLSAIRDGDAVKDQPARENAAELIEIIERANELRKTLRNRPRTRSSKFFFLSTARISQLATHARA